MQLDYPFEQVPLRTSDGYTAACVDGIAAIEYRSVDDWYFGPIRIEFLNFEPAPLGDRRLARKWVRASTADTCIIADHLTVKEKSTIEACIRSQMRQAEEAGDADHQIDAAKEAAL